MATTYRYKKDMEVRLPGTRDPESCGVCYIPIAALLRRTVFMTLRLIALLTLIALGNSCNSLPDDLPAAKSGVKLPAAADTYNAYIDYLDPGLFFMDSIIREDDYILEKIATIAKEDWDHLNLVVRMPPETPGYKVFELFDRFRREHVCILYLMVNNISDSVYIPCMIRNVDRMQQVDSLRYKYTYSISGKHSFINGIRLDERNYSSLASELMLNGDGVILLDLQEENTYQDLISMLDFYWYAITIHRDSLSLKENVRNFNELTTLQQMPVEFLQRYHAYYVVIH